MRLPLMVVALTLCLAAPARASFITFEVFGVVTGSFLSPPPGSYPGPVVTAPPVGSAFSLLMEFAYVTEYPVLPVVTFAFGPYIGTSSCSGCLGAALNPLSAASLFLVGNVMFTAQGPAALRVSGLTVTLNPGWQSGSFGVIALENAAQTGYVSGKVTSVNSTVRTVPVSEPSTWLLGMIGALFSVGMVRSRTFGGVR